MVPVLSSLPPTHVAALIEAILADVQEAFIEARKGDFARSRGLREGAARKALGLASVHIPVALRSPAERAVREALRFQDLLVDNALRGGGTACASGVGDVVLASNGQLFVHPRSALMGVAIRDWVALSNAKLADKDWNPLPAVREVSVEG